MKRNVPEEFVKKKNQSHILLSAIFPRKSYRLYCHEKNYGRDRQARDGSVTRRMHFACWITEAKDRLRIFITYCFSTATIFTRTRLNVTSYVHCLSC